MAWLLDEDDALKDKLTGFTVLNYGTDTQVPIAVYFRFPDPEIITRTFPHIAIDLTEINFVPERAQRGSEFLFNYATEQATPNPPGSYQSAYDFPLPFSLVYQLACYSRNPRHDRQMAGLLYSLFPASFGSIDMSNYDGTSRRADFVSSIRRDTVDNKNKRLYRNIFTIAVSTELMMGQVTQVVSTASSDISFNFTLNEALPVPV